MYTYPEALNAFQRIAVDLFRRAFEKDPVRFAHVDLNRMQVVVAADSRTGTASVDWKVVFGRLRVAINLPVKPATYRMTELEFKHWVAYNLHEVGHPLHTDKAVWDAAVERRAHRLLNSLEDVREEKCTIDLDLAVNALDLFSSLIDTLHAKAVADQYNPNNTRSIGWTLSALGRRANGYKIDLSDIDAKLDPKGTVGQIVAWALPALAACKSTQDCLDLADRITDALQAAPVKSNPVQDLIDEITKDLDMPESEDDASQDEPEPMDDEPQSPEPAGEFNPIDTGSENTTESAPEGPEGTQSGSNPFDQSEAKKDEPEAEKVAGDDLVDEVDLTANKSATVTSNNVDYDAIRRVTGLVRDIAGRTFSDKRIVGRNTPTYNGMSVDIVTAGASKMGRQRALLAAALKREESDDYEGGRLSGRIDRRGLTRLVMNDPHIFGKRTLTEGYDTDVQILIDGSTSMDGQKIVAAATLALVVAQAAAQVGVQCTAHLFSDDGLHQITKGRDKPLANRFAYSVNQVDGSTPLSYYLLTVATEQRRRAPGKRRIIFTITDGGCDFGLTVLKATGRYVEDAMGAEIANLHIGWHVMGAFRNEVAANLDDVTKSGVQSLTKVLERGL